MMAAPPLKGPTLSTWPPGSQTACNGQVGSWAVHAASSLLQSRLQYLQPSLGLLYQYRWLQPCKTLSFIVCVQERLRVGHGGCTLVVQVCSVKGG